MKCNKIKDNRAFVDVFAFKRGLKIALRLIFQFLPYFSIDVYWVFHNNCKSVIIFSYKTAIYVRKWFKPIPEIKDKQSCNSIKKSTPVHFNRKLNSSRKLMISYDNCNCNPEICFKCLIIVEILVVALFFRVHGDTRITFTFTFTNEAVTCKSKQQLNQLNRIELKILNWNLLGFAINDFFYRKRCPPRICTANYEITINK